MGLFNIFGKKSEPSPAEEALNRSKELFKEKNYGGSLGALIEGFRQDVNYAPLYEMAIKNLDAQGAEEESQLFRQALLYPQRFESYRNLGGHFIEVGHYPLAEPFLRKALDLQPTDVDTAHDLALAYARRFQVGKAEEVLLQVDTTGDFWALYFFTKCKILNGNLDKTEEQIQTLDAMLDSVAEDQNALAARKRVDELKEIRQRYLQVADPQRHIRDWQFIQYGGAILDYYDDPERYVAGGRYVASWGSGESIKALAVQLKAFLQHLGIHPREIKMMDERNSQIVGRVIGKELALNCSVYNAEDTHADCLIVASDSSLYNPHGELATIKNGQILFALNHDWLESSFITPEIIGFMSQSYYYPWSGDGFTVNPETQKMDRKPEDTRDVETIADEIYHLEPSEEKDHEALFDFYRERKDWLKGIGSRSNNHRYHFMVETPVPGSYFGH